MRKSSKNAAKKWWKADLFLHSYRLFDIYEGNQIKEGFKSVAYTITFRANDRTLEEKDVTAIMNKILSELSQMGIELRQ